MRKVGVCFFDDPQIAANGWTSVEGSKATRISGHGELATDVLWVTNMGHQDHRRLNFQGSQHIFDGQFFRTSISQLMDELGIDRSDSPAACEILSGIFSRMAHLGQKKYGIDITSCNYRYFIATQDVLTPSFARGTPQGDQPYLLQEAFKEATQINQGMTGKSKPKGTTGVSFYFPRSAYASHILSQKYPTGRKWTAIKKTNSETRFGTLRGDAIPGTKAILETLNRINEDHAAVFRVSVESIDKDYSAFATFGVSGPRSHPRHWATLPEILEMARYSVVKIEEGFTCPAGPLDLVERFEFNYSESSIAESLLNENIWVGLCHKMDTHHTPLGAYMRAYDRIACNRAAEILSQNNYTVGSYSTGRVIMFLRPTQYNGAREIAKECGLLAPLSILENG